MPRTPKLKPYTIPELLPEFEAFYGPRAWYSRNEPMRELAITILAQHTSDTNAERAFGLLWARYGDWQAIADAPVEDIVETIRTGGLAQQKGPRIKGVLQEIHRRLGSYDLWPLKERGFDGALEFLTTLNGIGPKTARCVLVFSLGIPAIPVDTHVHRVALRLGLLPPKMAADPAHPVIERMVPLEDRYRFHVYLIEHGRGVCRAISPRCGECPLHERCPHYASLLKAKPQQPRSKAKAGATRRALAPPPAESVAG
ncbi:MAG: endonuclease III [Dehalococcoidia bacterium]|nr:endonuclease III [Dehalococcoidia bacterium]